jgi:hypothetical protein
MNAIWIARPKTTSSGPPRKHRASGRLRSLFTCPDLRQAIHNYFAYRQDQESRRLRLLFRDGRVALMIGLAFLFSCVLLRELAFSFGNDAASDIFGEGMLIIGWVAMWRPLEIFLYEWVPIRRRRRILANLAQMAVIVQPKREQQT